MAISSSARTLNPNRKSNSNSNLDSTRIGTGTHEPVQGVVVAEGEKVLSSLPPPPPPPPTPDRVLLLWLSPHNAWSSSGCGSSCSSGSSGVSDERLQRLIHAVELNVGTTLHTTAVVLQVGGDITMYTMHNLTNAMAWHDM